MSRWRLILVWILLILPWLIIIGFGSYALWRIGWTQWIWLPIAICWGSALILMRRWRTRWKVLTSPKAKQVPHWTPRDRDAWELVEKRARGGDDLDQERLLRPQMYFDLALEMAAEIAAIYHPKSSDPVENLTIPEILAAAQLVFEDLTKMVDQYVPAGHLLTIKHWRRLSQVPKWYEKFSKVYWPVSAVFAPATVVARYATSRMVITPIKDNIQDNLLSWFYVSYVHRLGFYIIELNSGRLAGGAERFRDMMDRMNEDFDATGNPENTAATTTEDVSDSSKRSEITICLVGQTNAGKSSLINAMLGQQKAEVDLVPSTSTITRFQLHRTETNDHLTVLDTVGYATEGFTSKQRDELETALKQSDLVLLVMNAANPAKQPDAEVVKMLQDWFQSRRDLPPIPVLGVLTHIDRLRPLREWNPPYEWPDGERPKELSIREAVEYHNQVLEDHVAAVIPVCTDGDQGRVFGIDEYLLPAMTPLLGDARASALLRSLHQDISKNKASRVMQQFWEAGKVLLKAGLSKRD